MASTTQDRLPNMKDQSIEARPEMVTRGTQTNMTMRQDFIRSLSHTSSNLKDTPVVYAALQNVETIQTEVIYEEHEDLNEATITKPILPQKPDEILTFLVQSDNLQPSAQHPPPIYSEVKSDRQLPLAPLHPPPYHEVQSDGSPLPSAQLQPPPYYEVRQQVRKRTRSSERPRSLQPNEVSLPDGAQQYATTSRTRPSSYIETFSLEKDLKPETTFRARSYSTLEQPVNSSTLKRNIAAAKAEATKNLMKAAERGDTRAVVEAIAEGANVDQRDSVRRTPLHLAVVGGHEEIVKRLIEAGADKDKKDSMGRTPLHYTALRGRIDCAQILLNGGADPNQRDSSGMTPTALATMKHHSGVATVLKRKGGQDCSIS